MKTVLIYDQLGESPISFLVLDGDYSRFNGVYVNAYDGDDILMQELCELVYPDGNYMRKGFVKDFPVDAVLVDNAKVVVCGFLP